MMIMKSVSFLRAFAVLAMTLGGSHAFVVVGGGGGGGPGASTSTAALTTTTTTATTTTTLSTTAVFMAKPSSSDNNNNNNADLLRSAKASRQAGVNDRVVELVRPLGVILQEDSQGNVFVETVAPRGNAARSGMVKEGDIVTMCSATFGDQMWSCRGVGLTRVLAAIRVRAGATVKLALESPNEGRKKADLSSRQRKAAEDARKAAQAKKDSLLQELEETEQKLKKGKFFGLF